jgi:hypothetical protein
MSTPLSAGDHDLRALAGIVSKDRSDLPDRAALPPSLLADLMDQIAYQAISVERSNTPPPDCQRPGLWQVPLRGTPRRSSLIGGFIGASSRADVPRPC